MFAYWQANYYISRKKTRQQNKKNGQSSMAGIWKTRHNCEGYTTNTLKKISLQPVHLPAMTYGAETWTLTTNIEKKLSGAQHNTERNMLNINYKDRETYNWTRDQTGLIMKLN